MKRRPAVVLVDPASLDEETKASLRAKARAAVAQEVQEKSADALYQQYLEEERRALNPQEEIKYFTLDMAGHADRIMLDGVVFFHGVQYAQPKSKYDSLRDIVARGWEHETEIGYANRNLRKATPQQRSVVLSPNNAVGAR